MNERIRAEFGEYAAAAAPALLRSARRLTSTREDAEDLVQTTLAKMMAAWPRIRQREAVDAYTRRVMINSQTSQWRRRRPVTSSPLDDWEPAPADPRGSSPLEAVHDREWLRPALARLTPRQRTVLVLRYCQDLPEAEVALLLGVTVGTIKSTTSTALQKLRHNLAARP